MTKDQLRKLLDSNILLLSSRPGAEQNFTEFYEEEMDRGANVLFAPDLRTCGISAAVLEKVVAAAGEKAFSACCIPPVEDGLSLYGGSCAYDEYYRRIYKQAQTAYQAGVSFLILGGFSNLTEAKCAVFAAREACPLPLCVGLEFDDDILLENGIDPVKAVITLQSLGVCAVGAMGRNADDTLEALAQMREFASVPLFALPSVSEFMTPEDLADYMPEFAGNLCALAGTENGSAAYTAALSKALWQLETFHPDFHEVHGITGLSGIIFYDFKNKMIGENKRLLEISLERAEDAEPVVRRLILSQSPPVCFKSKDLDALELVLKLYPGRAAVKSDEYGEIAAKEYGAFVLPEER